MIKILSQSGEVCVSGIYKITCLVNEKVYIGSAVNLNKRCSQHFHYLKNNTHHSRHLQNAFNKYGSENFTFEVIEFIDNVRCLIRAEQVWLDYFKGANPRYGFNLCPKAGSVLGVKRSLESRAKRSEFMKGNLRNLGKKASLETRVKIGLASKLRGFSKSHRSKVTASLVNNYSFYWVAISPDGVLYDSIFNLSEFCRDHNLNCAGIRRVANGEQKSKKYKGWQCRKVEKVL